MRLCPDGKHLLCLKRLAEADPPAPGGASPRASWQLRLRDLETGQDKVLLTPSPGWETVYTRFNLFDPTGKTLLLPEHTETRSSETGQGTGAASVTRQMELSFCDVASGKVRKAGVAGPRVWAKFDRTGKHLILNRYRQWGEGMDEAGQIIYTATLPKLELKPLRARGIPQSICPTADTMVIFVPPGRVRRPPGGPRPERAQPKLLLYDSGTDKLLAELPSDRPSSSWDDWESQWTVNGRYLYYPGAKEDTVQTPEGPRNRTVTVSCIWDRVAGRQLAVIDQAVAVGPGPTPTTMVLGRREPERKGIILHEASSGKSWTLDPNACVQHALGGFVVYLRAAPDGKQAAYLARIAVSDDDGHP